MFTKVISRRHLHLYIKSVVRRPYQLAPRAVQNHFNGIDQFAPVQIVGGGGMTSQELFKIVGML